MKNIFKIVFGIIICSVILLININSALADEKSDNNSKLRGGLHIGYSPYTGIIGAEIQKSHFGLTIGAPTFLGIKYYPDEEGYRWFFGAHAMYYSLDEDQTKDGINYKSEENTSAGLGFGYKWRWRNHWELSTSLSLEYSKEKLKNDSSYRTDSYILAMPGVTFGYSF